jgi:hypothetical protein
VYVIFFFINLFPPSPVSCPDNTDDVIPIGEADGHDPFIDLPDTIESLLFTAVTDILGNDTMRVKECALGHGKGNAMLALIFSILLIVPVENDCTRIPRSLLRGKRA